MSFLYHEILYQPFLNALVFFYNTIAFGDLGLAIIFLTLLIRIILFPVFQKSVREQAVMQRIQPHLKKIREEHKNDPRKQWEATMALHKEHHISPFSGFLLLLVQLPVLIALYQISIKILSPEVLGDLYSFVRAPAELSHTFLGLINLGESNMVIVGLAALAQYFQGKLGLRKTAPNAELSSTEKMARQMVFIAPILTLVIFMRVPAAVSLYWFATSIFSIAQQLIINKQLDHGQSGNIHQKNN
ncbi:MAG: YidC/Oxa1 family membrane protein insertase [Patescibacteria group bacterium]